MQVKIKHPLLFGKKVQQAGAIITTNDTHGNELIRKGFAFKVEGGKSASKQAQADTTAKDDAATTTPTAKDDAKAPPKAK